jgi:hypothetical protein
MFLYAKDRKVLPQFGGIRRSSRQPLGLRFVLGQHAVGSQGQRLRRRPAITRAGALPAGALLCMTLNCVVLPFVRQKAGLCALAPGGKAP